MSDERKNKTKLLQVIGSVMAAFFGVQSSKNKKRDFEEGNHKVFIITGLVFTVIFMLSVYGLVQLVLANAR